MLNTLTEMIVTEPANDIRIKVTNRCSWDCKWCHHEGSNINRDLVLNSAILGFLQLMKDQLDISSIHLTGGEPTLYPELAQHIRTFTQMGFEVSVTSNGSKPGLVPVLWEAGLKRVNFSLHTLDPKVFADFHATPRSEAWASNSLRSTMDSIVYAKALGIAVKVNTTIVDSSSDWRPIYEFCRREDIPFRIQNELSSPSALTAIEEMISSVSGTLIKVVRKGSTSRISYEYADARGYRFRVKLIAPASMVHLCGGCPVKQFCTEGFYTIRLEPSANDNFNVRLCIHRNDAGAVFSPGEFLKSKIFEELKEQNRKQYSHSHTH